MEKKDFITEIEKNRELFKNPNFDKYLSKSALYGYLNGKYDIEILDKYYKSQFDYLNSTVLDIDILDDLVKMFVPYMQKYGKDGEPEEIDGEYDVPLATSINIVFKFIDELLPEYEEHFMDIMSNRLYLINGHGSLYDMENDEIKIYDSNSIATCYVLLHELIHSENDGDFNNRNFTFEVPSHASEYFLNDYIKGYFNHLEKDSNTWIRGRLSSNVEVFCRYAFLRKIKELLNKGIALNKDVVNDILCDIASELGVNAVYVLSSIESIFFNTKQYDDILKKIKDSEIEDVTIEQFKENGLKRHDKDLKKLGEIFANGYNIIIKCIEHAIGATLGFKLYQNMYDNDYDTKEFRSINANIHNYSVEDLLTILSLKDKNGYNKDELNNMKEAFQKRLKRLDNE